VLTVASVMRTVVRFHHLEIPMHPTGTVNLVVRDRLSGPGRCWS